MENDTRDDIIMNLDLNQEPLHPPVDSVLGLGSLLNELETTHGQIEERIRQLEAVTARARLRQRWRQARNPPETSNISTDNTIETIVNTGGEGRVHNGEYSMAAQERTVLSGKSCKSDGTLLVAKALGMDTEVKRVSGDGGSFFDCNICLYMAREPIVTSCGHLFCWSCFYQLPFVYLTTKECPVCKEEVIDTNITPIYGNGDDTHMSGLESGLNVPRRPPAHRRESVRQQRINRGVSYIPVEEALRRIRTGIGAMGERPQRQDLDGVSDSSNRTNISANQVPTSELLPSTEAGGSRRLHSRQFSRVLSESAASLSSISSALNNAERLVVDLESYIRDRLLRRSHAQFLPVDGRDPFTSNAAIIQLDQQTVDSIPEINSTVPLPSSSRITNLSAAVVQLENLTTDTGTEMNLSVPHPSSSRRRSGVSRASDVESGVSREHRRRRLR
uniref:E3 ubiquitin-protein ligase RMA n=1 Tax=Davidia involucrata TaxID=16924 RepID=A0A5B7BQG0_DAVIN